MLLQILNLLLLFNLNPKKVPHGHNHSHNDEKQKEIYSGIFEDEEVKDRELSDWEGDWQSVYPYLLDGTLDVVLQKKVETKEG